MVGIARISRMHRWVFCKPRNPWLDFQKKYDPCLRVLVTRAREANETHLSNSEKEFHPNGGRRGISIRKLEAHFRIVYFGARWTTIGIQGARIPLCASIASICIRIDRFETCPTFSGCRIFIDNKPRYNPRFFSTSKLKKKSFKAFNSVF